VSKAKHFNQGVILGEVMELKKEKAGEVPYLLVKVDCDGPYGSVLAFCKIWNTKETDRIGSFLKQFRKGSMIKITGSLAQYKGRHDKVKSNFNAFKFVPWDPRLDENPCRRAKFILVGEVAVFDEDDGGGIATVKYVNKNYTAELKVRVPLEKSFDVEVGSVSRLEGYLRQVDAATIPVIDDIRVMGDQEGTEGEDEPEDDDIPF